MIAKHLARKWQEIKYLVYKKTISEWQQWAYLRIEKGELVRLRRQRFPSCVKSHGRFHFVDTRQIGRITTATSDDTLRRGQNLFFHLSDLGTTFGHRRGCCCGQENSLTYLPLKLKVLNLKYSFLRVKSNAKSGLSFGHFNENSRRKKLKLKSKKLKTQEQKTKNSRIFSKH